MSETYFLNPDLTEKLRAEIESLTTFPTDGLFGNQLCGIRIVEMPNQKANGWLISDKTIAESYEAGRITEDDLRAIAKLNNQIAENQ